MAIIFKCGAIKVKYNEWGLIICPKRSDTPIPHCIKKNHRYIITPYCFKRVSKIKGIFVNR